MIYVYGGSLIILLFFTLLFRIKDTTAEKYLCKRKCRWGIISVLHQKNRCSSGDPDCSQPVRMHRLFCPKPQHIFDRGGTQSLWKRSGQLSG